MRLFSGAVLAVIAAAPACAADGPLIDSAYTLARPGPERVEPQRNAAQSGWSQTVRYIQPQDAAPTAIVITAANGAKVKLRPTRVRFTMGF